MALAVTVAVIVAVTVVADMYHYDLIYRNCIRPWTWMQFSSVVAIQAQRIFFAQHDVV